ncbi:HNH endonuclease signature motif containing protein [Microbacterium invictum]|uniref:HNH nuclease domain-containing protein n=1 Tax=Microbacterium invictum TaxID=515415 RepID=A0AA40SSF5_9MICO|nr:HNH endonuclease signature motif containing protein [Microbacterium invictum]MBB4141401.1 hypothetical protein [Microbacterium invictum]
MNTLSAPIADLQQQAAQVVREGATSGVLQGVSESELANILSDLAVAQRLVEAAMVDVVGEVMRRSEGAFVADRMTSRMGCRNVGELIERLTRVAGPTASRLQKAAKAVRPVISGTTGELLEAELPELREAMVDGVVGVDGVLAIATPLKETGRRVPHEVRRQAVSVVVAEARGEGPDGSPPLSADLLRVQASAWALALDQDGAEPRERASARKRFLRLGAETPYGFPVNGMIMPEVAALLMRVHNAQHSPRSVEFVPDGADVPEPPRDDRTHGQKLHDTLATVLQVAAASGVLPTIGGAAPTLVVSVTEEELESGRGYAHAEDCEQPLSIAAALHVACSGVIQRVVSRRDGRILRISVEDRVFNRYQRRAIALRDGGCIIPGCGVPAAWSEIHHVVEHAKGGPTHTDNGVLLCWYHHRFLESIGWKIRMNAGVPEVRAPYWLDPSPKWRPVTTSPTRLRSKVLQT